MSAAVEFAHLEQDGRPVEIEYRWLGAADASAPLMVFLHEGLGSLAMWKDFPDRLCAALDCRGLVYSRPGYGRSTARAPAERWGVDFMHRQAQDLLPALLAELDVDCDSHPPWLFGHSDGASIALLYAACFPARIAGAILLAPHIRVEDVCIESIEKAREVYLETDLRQRLAAYHDDPDSAFWGWNDIWLDPAFRAWNIEAELDTIRCPLLALQGLDDEYGTLAQIHGIAERVPGTRLVELARCGHSPHRDQAERVIEESGRFLVRHRAVTGAARAVCSAG